MRPENETSGGRNHEATCGRSSRGGETLAGRGGVAATIYTFLAAVSATNTAHFSGRYTWKKKCREK